MLAPYDRRRDRDGSWIVLAAIDCFSYDGLCCFGWKLFDYSLMTTRETIRTWLIERADKAYCAGCITDAMNLFDLGYVRDATRFLASKKSRFHRFTGICFRCGNARVLIRANEQDDGR